jgi:hypothetical protein
MKRVKGVEDLNICIIGAQGIVGVGAIIHNALHRAGGGLSAGRKDLDRLTDDFLPERMRPGRKDTGTPAGCVRWLRRTKQKDGTKGQKALFLPWSLIHLSEEAEHRCGTYDTEAERTFCRPHGPIDEKCSFWNCNPV